MTQSLIPTVWHQGELEGSQGTSKERCPYEQGSEEAHYWNQGWDLGVKTFLVEKDKLKTIELISNT